MIPRPTLNPASLPAELTSLVGRRNDITALRVLCAHARLATVTGTGGVGKTRLAYRVAADLSRSFRDGVQVVELASVSDPALLASTVVAALGLHDAPAIDPAALLIESLQPLHLLLVLDNCEHMIDTVADLVGAILSSAPDVRIIATSRQPLRVAGESTYPVAPLTTPHPETLIPPGTALNYPSVELFVERASAAIPDFVLTAENERAVVELCQRLEGIPLALELAAVRMRVLTVSELVSRLDDRFALLRESHRNLPARHQTLQAMVDWSHDLCSALEQTLWARSSVFAGSFDMAAIEAVCTDELLRADSILDIVAGLLDKSIFLRDDHAGTGRFRMLETIRSYGQVVLERRGETRAFGARHRDWVQQVLERTGLEWVASRRQDWPERLHRLHGNLRRAIEFAISYPDETHSGLRLPSAPWFWTAVGNLTEGRLWLDRALAVDDEPTCERACALASAGYLTSFLGDPAAAAELSARAHALAVRLGDPTAIAYATHILGASRIFTDDPTSAVPYLVDALGLYAESDLPDHYPDGLRVELAGALILARRLDEAALTIDEAFEHCVAKDDRWNMYWALWGRGYIALLRGDPDRAEEDLCEALAMKKASNDTMALPFILELIAWTAASRGEADRAATLFGTADPLWRAVAGGCLLEQDRASYEPMARAALGPDAFATAFNHGRTLSLDAAVALAQRQRTSVVSSSTPQTQAPVVTLTTRQREVAALVGAGLSNKDIAERLVISLRTAEGHVEGILIKLGFSSRAQVAAWVASQSAASPDRN